MDPTPRYPYLHVDVRAAEAEDVSVLLFEVGAQGVEERDATTLDKPQGEGAEVTLVASFETEEAVRDAIAALAPEHHARLVFVEGDAWRDAWKAFFKPTRIGARLVVRPSWEPFDAAPGDVVLTLDPGRAFGTGTHETTRLVLGELDARVQGGERLLDVGTGSGILAVAALLLGARSAVGVDDDADALAVARENAALNRVADRFVAVETDVARLEETFPLVVANIEARVLIPLAPVIAARVAAGGTLILSGVLAGQDADVAAAYPAFRVVATPRDGEWVAIVLRRV